MGIVETVGIITKEVRYGEADRILTILSKDFGRISAIARRVRSNKSGLLAGTQLFCYNKFILFQGREKSLYQINEVQLLESFQPLRDSLTDMAYASYFCEIANFFTSENDPDPALLSLLLNTLYLLANHKKAAPQLKAVFLFRVLAVAGFTPELTGCHSCGAPAPPAFLSLNEGVGLCAACGTGRKQTAALSDGLVSAIRYICSAEDNRLYAFRLSDEALDYLGELGDRYLAVQADHTFRTLDYLKQVLALG